jgi:hypothetical protein
MNKREKIIAVILFVTFFWWFMTLRVKPKEQTAQSSLPLNNAEQTIKVPRSSEITDGIDLSKVIGHIEVKMTTIPDENPKDPFAKPSLKEKLKDSPLSITDLKLAGIMREANQAVALINDEILRVGDNISGFEIVEVRQNEVLLKRDQEQYILKLFNELDEISKEE